MRLVFCIVFCVLMASAIAEIELSNELQETYILGMPIDSSFLVSLDSNQSALFRLRLVCDSYEIEYFVTLIDLSKDSTLDPPALMPTDSMVGECSLSVRVETLEKELVGSYTSPFFQVTNSLDVSIGLDSSEPTPGTTVTLTGQIRPTGEFTILLSFAGSQETFAAGSEFSRALVIPSTIKSGEQVLNVHVTDDYNNQGDATVSLTIKPKLTALQLLVNKEAFNPGETLSIKAEALDQAATLMEQTIAITITHKTNIIHTGKIESADSFEYKLPPSANPGEYLVEIEAGEIKEQVKVQVAELKKLNVSLEGGIVRITNIGNIPYDDTVNLNLYSEDGILVLNQHIKLDPKEEANIDLSKRVAADNYTISSTENGTNVTLGTDVFIPDNRSFFTKITGAVIGIDGVSSFFPIFALVIVFLLLLGIYLKRKMRH
ncbi:MAG TPA: hypothetical protein VJH97_02095 [Candidatus Nanoarchaeia archaeon]|nr:hypothetical protein [Candidatus Nanoarchaeia archaeon]